MPTLPPNRNIPAPKPQNGDLVKRTGEEKLIEDSMRRWYAMREERDEALGRIQELERDLIEATTEASHLRSRNLDLEHKHEALLVNYAKLEQALSGLGSQADTISMAVSEILALARNSTMRGRVSESNREDPSSPPPSLSTSPEIQQALDELTQVLSEEETKAAENLARRLSPLPPTHADEEPQWPNSNSPSPKPTPSTPTTGPKPDETNSASRWKK
jgi:hypothetical protein